MVSAAGTVAGTSPRMVTVTRAFVPLSSTVTRTASPYAGVVAPASFAASEVLPARWYGAERVPAPGPGPPAGPEAAGPLPGEPGDPDEPDDDAPGPWDPPGADDRADGTTVSVATGASEEGRTARSRRGLPPSSSVLP